MTDERERILEDKPEVRAAVELGLKQSAHGEVVSLGSFDQYAD